jgi:beta-glucosidase-like glycosyl hydrolase
MARSLSEMLSPFMIVGLEGTTLTTRERALLSTCPPAGIILFARNVESMAQLRALTADVESAFSAAGGRRPIIAADHEGGVVSVLARAIGTPPSQMAVGRAADFPLIGRLFEENARRMLACGVNMMLGPVADVNVEHRNPIIGTRSFGEDMATVSRCVSEAVAGARRAGILTCLKHFPGHGSTRADSHLTLPVLGATLKALKEKDVVPFMEGFAAGAESVMVGHVVPMDRRLSASLDWGIVTGLLRDELGFHGVAMTDALEMAGARTAERGSDGGVSERGGAFEGGNAVVHVCKRALEAGNDILLFSRPLAEVFAELDASGGAATENSFESAELSARMRESLERAARLIDRIARERPVPGAMGFDDDLYDDVASASVRVLQHPSSFVPLAGRAGFNVVFWADAGAFERPPVEAFMQRALETLNGDLGYPGGGGIRAPEKHFGVMEEYARAYRDAARSVGSDLELAAYSFGEGSPAPPAVVFLLNRRPLDATTVRRICSDVDAVVVAEWPYAAGYVDPGSVVVVTYGIYEAAASVVCARLLGAAGHGAESR